MAYTATYKVHVTNEQNQEVLATIYKKDGAVVNPIPEYMCSSMELSDKSDGQTKYESTIIIRELTMSIWTEDGDAITWETFIASTHDDWKIIVLIDGQPYFEGFIVPDEGSAMFQDKPYEVIIAATSGLSLLKDIDLLDVNNEQFLADNTIISYIAGALKQTGLNLPIRVRCNYFNHQMNDKADGLNYDMFQQTKLDYRTFKKDAVTYVSCYDALMIILDKFCRLEYWNGYWQIKCIGELQYTPNGNDYYVDYDANGENPAGALESENHAQVGKAVDIYPINEDQQIYSRFAVKSSKTIYMYNIVPSLLDNDGLGILGNQISSGDLYDVDDEDNDGDTSEVIGSYKTFELVGWVHKKKFLAEVNPITNAYIKVEYDLYNREKSRYYVVERDATAPVDSGTLNYIRNTTYDFYVAAGDKVDISVTARINASLSIDFRPASVLIFTGGDPTNNLNYYVLDPFGKFQGPGGATQIGGLKIDGTVVDTAKWNTASFDNIDIPVNGTLIVKLCCAAAGSSLEMHFKDLTVTYKVFVGGSYFSAKGDYWFRSQDKVFLDKSEEEIKISDSQRRITKGALIVEDILSEPSWYRYGHTIPPFNVTERRHFKELLNLARFNHSYRRMYAIEGTFNGLNYSPENNQLQKYPIGFHKRYRLVDISPNRDFVLVPPLKMDLIKGWTTMNLVEVINTANSDDGTQEGDNASFNYIFNNNG